ncbi:MAG: hypothetical protein KC464_28990, partial [Myxococcales bacterium]|nr:hypothetical protein [Myxococcales bacterium]
MSPGGVFAHLPEAVRARLPALDDPAWQGEARADCARCPMAAAGGPHPWAFSPETRCCTAHPSLANFLVGRALGRAGPGPALIRARLADPDGVTAFGIEPSAARERRYRDTIDVAFGRDVTLRCPYWVGGDHSCGVWHDRGATCRAWFCKHDHGLVGAVAWSRASFLVSELEGRIARWCVGAGGAPADPADAAAWIAWYQ